MPPIKTARRIAIVFCGMNVSGTPKSEGIAHAGGPVRKSLEPGLLPARSHQNGHRPDTANACALPPGLRYTRERRPRRVRGTRCAPSLGGVQRGKLEHVALADVLRRPGLGRELQLLRLVEIRPLVLAPSSARSAAGSRGRRRTSRRARRARLVVEVLAERLQEHRVEPPPLDVEQVAGGDVVGRVDAAADQLLGLSRNRRSPVSRWPSSSALSELPDPRPGPW